MCWSGHADGKMGSRSEQGSVRAPGEARRSCTLIVAVEQPGHGRLALSVGRADLGHLAVRTSGAAEVAVADI
jgi:hypothetical protein